MTETPEQPQPPETPQHGDADHVVIAVDTMDAEQATGPEAGLWSDAWHTLRRSPKFVVSAAMVAVFTLMAMVPQLFTIFYPGERDPQAATLSMSPRQAGVGRPSADAWFGYDLQGYDLFARTIHGARVSILVGLLVVGGSLILAVVFGSLAGYYGGLLDTLIARLTDIVFSVPTILGAIVFLSVVEDLPSWIPVIDDRRDIWEVALVLVLFGWPSMLRLMRSSVLSNREADYVLASKALGAKDRRLIINHIIPNSLAPVIVYATIYVGVIISAEAALSFLGIGLQLPAISWGLSINQATPFIDQAPHLLIAPGAFLTVTVLSFIMLGDSLRDALDPKLR